MGSPLTQLIARQVRAAQVYCQVHPAHIGADGLRAQAADGQLRGIIVSGHHDEGAAQQLAAELPPEVFQLGVPVLAVGAAMPAMALQLGGRLGARLSSGQQTEVRARGHTALLRDIADHTTAQGHGMLQVWLGAAERVDALPPGFKLMASGTDGGIVGLADEERRLYGLGFHPELDQTLQGRAIIQRFVRDICQARPDWDMRLYVDEAVQVIRQQVGSQRVLLGLSGGVDSSVCAALIHRAIGDQLTCVFVDHGLLRLNEADMVLQMFAGQLHAKVVHVDASAQFLNKLKDVSDPEQKRKVIGHEFIEVFKAEAAKLVTGAPGQGDIRFLAQGTIYPDVIESGGVKGKKSATIKSHHNVGGLPEQLGLDLLEPLRELFKDEVRALGLALGLPPEMVHRHPFPGPGLGVRILGEVKPEYADLLRRADAIFTQELRATVDPASGQNWYQRTSQAFAVFLPVRSVGVTNQQRTYEYAVALRAVVTTDFMSAEAAELPYALLKKVSTRIIQEVPGINRVTYDVSGKPPATIEWE